MPHILGIGYHFVETLFQSKDWERKRFLCNQLHKSLFQIKSEKITYVFLWITLIIILCMCHTIK
jgi:hypothetical protein